MSTAHVRTIVPFIVAMIKSILPCPSGTKLRSSKYLNNVIEQDHRGVKQRIAVMLGFKGFQHAAITIGGIELMHRIRKGQSGPHLLAVQGRTASALWDAVLRA
jgi:transposase-like protein